VVLTEWDEFRWQDPAELAATMTTPSVVDARNLLDRARWERHGFVHRGIGR
jgi:UDPglucose 6-dehydrogenase